MQAEEAAHKKDERGKGSLRMYKRLLAYRLRIDTLLANCDEHTDWEAVLREHVAQISFFQHERLIHLLVTLAFAFMELACTIATVVFSSLQLVALMVLFLVLLIPYVVHYYHLENGTQALYEQYDKILSKAFIHGASDGQNLLV